MSPEAREERYGGQPNVSDAAVGLFCLFLLGAMCGYGFAKYHTKHFERPQAEAK
jgi:hypothetical protein